MVVEEGRDNSLALDSLDLKARLLLPNLDNSNPPSPVASEHPPPSIISLQLQLILSSGLWVPVVFLRVLSNNSMLVDLARLSLDQWVRLVASLAVLHKVRLLGRWALLQVKAHWLLDLPVLLVPLLSLKQVLLAPLNSDPLDNSLLWEQPLICKIS